MKFDPDVIVAGERIKAFLADEYVTLALEAMQKDALQKFLSAKTDEELRFAQALSKVTDTFAGRLASMVEAGQLARNAEEG